MQATTFIVHAQVFAEADYPGWAAAYGSDPVALASFPERLDELLLKTLDDLYFVRSIQA